MVKDGLSKLKLDYPGQTEKKSATMRMARILDSEVGRLSSDDEVQGLQRAFCISNQLEHEILLALRVLALRNG